MKTHLIYFKHTSVFKYTEEHDVNHFPCTVRYNITTWQTVQLLNRYPLVSFYTSDSAFVPVYINNCCTVSFLLFLECHVVHKDELFLSQSLIISLLKGDETLNWLSNNKSFPDSCLYCRGKSAISCGAGTLLVNVYCVFSALCLVATDEMIKILQDCWTGQQLPPWRFRP